MKRHILTLMAVLLTSSTAIASLAPPVKISREGETVYAEAGLEYTGSFLVETRVPLEIEFLELEGKGWTGTYLAAPPSVSMSHDDAYSATFGGTPSVDAGPLQLVYTVSGVLFRRTLDPGPSASTKLLNVLGDIQPREIIPVAKSYSGEDSGVGPAPAPEQKVRAAQLKTVFDESHDMRQSDKAAPASRTITVTGRAYFREPDWKDPYAVDRADTNRPGNPDRGVRGATVRVYDEDSTYDDFLGDGLTDDDGNFSITFTWDPCWTCDSTPDLYVEIEAANTRVEVEDSVWENNYYLETPTWDDYTGSSLDIGSMRFNDEDKQAVFFMLMHATRTFWLIEEVSGRVTDTVDIQFPGENNNYLTFWEEIHITQERGFWSGTVVHEYGHHFIENYGDTGDTDTCNGMCDFDGCGHCGWCRESGGVAWSEGWPQWLADFYARRHVAEQGYWPPTYRLVERIRGCPEDGWDIHSYRTTENRLAALMRDLEDTENENDPFSPYPDAMSADPGRMFSVADLDEPTNPLEFFLNYKARYSPPEPAFWETATNGGYANYDFTPPSAPLGFQSQSHDAGVPTSANKIFLDWDASTDDISQVERYIYEFTFNNPAMPDTNITGTSNLFAKSPQLSPGTYYANIIAQDRAGNWSNHISLGPYFITEPPDADLAFYQRVGWDEALIPHNLNTLEDDNVPEPLFLIGNGLSTYWNTTVIALGPTGVPDSTDLQVFVDGEAFPWLFPPAENIDSFILPAFNEPLVTVNNIGPVSVRGGRHVFSVRGDVNDEVFESDEDNNVAGRSWVWSPAPMTEDVDLWRGSPPDIIGGWEDITSGNLYFNCDGLQFSSTGWWNAVTLVPELTTSDFDVRLHAATTGPTDGFYAPLGWSSRGDGLTDAVLVNRNWVGEEYWDVAVWPGNSDPDPGSYKARHVTSEAFTYGDSVGVAMGDGEVLTLHEVYVAPADTGTAQVIVRTDPAQGPLWVVWFNSGFQYGDLTDAEAGTFTDESGFARFQVSAPAANYYGVAVYRDATDGNGVAPESFSLEIGAPSPDVMAYTPPGWSRPLIPWEDTDDLNGPIPTPATLNGWDETWVHSATINPRPTGTTGPYIQTLGVDGSTLGSPVLSGGFAGSDSLKRANATEIAGGRHTLWMRCEWPGWQSIDTSPENNFWAEQWVWTPHQMVLDVPRTIEAPPAPTAGWDKLVNPAQTVPDLYYNCLGLRTPVFQTVGSQGAWAAVTATPADSLTDIDLRLHDELSSGAKSGFSTSMLTSAAGGAGQTEFAILNLAAQGNDQYDVGILEGQQAQPGAVGAKVTATSSSYLGTDGVTPAGVYGPFPMAAGSSMTLFEVWLEVGDHAITLDNISGGANLGLSLHGNGIEFVRASDDSTSGTAWLEPAGADEYLPILVDTAGYHAVAVWKAGWDDLEASVQFSLDFTSGGITGTPPDVPGLATRIESVQPNPFNPQTTVAFTVQETDNVTVTIYDLRGQRVRTLQQGDLAPGRHQRVWDGRDETGRNAATGTYLVRLRTGSVVDHRKIMLLK